LEGNKTYCRYWWHGERDGVKSGISGESILSFKVVQFVKIMSFVFLEKGIHYDKVWVVRRSERNRMVKVILWWRVVVARQREKTTAQARTNFTTSYFRISLSAFQPCQVELKTIMRISMDKLPFQLFQFMLNLKQASITTCGNFIRISTIACTATVVLYVWRGTSPAP
jgi:hypothetical protein